MHALVAGGYEAAVPGICMHEFVLTLEKLKHETGVSALDVAKAMIDRGIHPPTMYFPLIVHEALMLEPTETESRETLDECARAMLDILKEAHTRPRSSARLPRHHPHRAAGRGEGGARAGTQIPFLTLCAARRKFCRAVFLYLKATIYLPATKTDGTALFL